MDTPRDDDPIDDCTHWVGKIPEQNTNSHECATERSLGRSQQPDIQCEKLPVDAGRKDAPGLLDRLGAR